VQQKSSCVTVRAASIQHAAQGRPVDRPMKTAPLPEHITTARVPVTGSGYIPGAAAPGYQLMKKNSTGLDP